MREVEEAANDDDNDNNDEDDPVRLRLHRTGPVTARRMRSIWPSATCAMMGSWEREGDDDGVNGIVEAEEAVLSVSEGTLIASATCALEAGSADGQKNRALALRGSPPSLSFPTSEADVSFVDAPSLLTIHLHSRSSSTTSLLALLLLPKFVPTFAVPLSTPELCGAVAAATVAAESRLEVEFPSGLSSIDSHTRGLGSGLGNEAVEADEASDDGRRRRTYHDVTCPLESNSVPLAPVQTLVS